MTLPITPGADQRSRGGFTLIELILVMALLLIVASLISPQLAGFFRGRSLDAEARRFLSLTRYAQSRAVSEGVPMVLWIDAQQRTYGLEMQAGYAATDRHAVAYELERDLEVQVEQPLMQPIGNLELSRQESVTRVYQNLSTILFTPEGFVSQSSPEAVTIVRSENGTVRDSVRIGMGRTRLNYEIQTANAAPLR
jgi:type II secretion system protein H